MIKSTIGSGGEQTDIPVEVDSREGAAEVQDAEARGADDAARNAGGEDCGAPSGDEAAIAYVSGSEMFRLVTKLRSLRHPTAAAFEPGEWIEAYRHIDGPNSRDLRLLAGAVHFGLSTRMLRLRVPEALVEPFTRESGTRLLVSIANEQYVVLRRKLASAGRRAAKEGMGHVQQMAMAPILAATGQAMSADDHVTHLVDALPHWLHHLRAIPPEKRAESIEDPFVAARDALLVASLERGLRDCWQASLWEGRDLEDDAGMRHLVPHDPATAERWFAWFLREQSNMSWESVIDAAAVMISGGKPPPVEPVRPRTVVEIERRTGRKPRIVVGRADGRGPRQRKHVGVRDMLDRLYTGLFLDEVLPTTGDLHLTCRELCQAWWALADLVDVQLDEIGTDAIVDAAGLQRCSLTWPVEAVVDALARSLEIGRDRASALFRMLTLDPRSTSALFDESLWWTPAVPASDGRCHLLAAPLFIGNPIRLVEHWLEVGGITDQRRLRGRGRPFEAHVRKTLADKLAGNRLITDAAVLPRDLKRKGESEEIDLLVRIGDVVIVGEVKCFLSPVEPNDRYNYLVALEAAAEQARRKTEWVDANRAAALASLGVADPRKMARMRLQSLVVLNQGYGIGLSVQGVPIVDLHYLSLMLGSGRFQSEMAFTEGKSAGAVSRFYGSQSELEAKLGELLRDPPPLKRYFDAIGWTAVPFPSPDGKPLMIHMPHMAGSTISEASERDLMERLNEQKPNR